MLVPLVGSLGLLCFGLRVDEEFRVRFGEPEMVEFAVEFNCDCCELAIVVEPTSGLTRGCEAEELEPVGPEAAETFV